MDETGFFFFLDGFSRILSRSLVSESFVGFSFTSSSRGFELLPARLDAAGFLLNHPLSSSFEDLFSGQPCPESCQDLSRPFGESLRPNLAARNLEDLCFCPCGTGGSLFFPPSAADARLSLSSFAFSVLLRVVGGFVSFDFDRAAAQSCFLRLLLCGWVSFHSLWPGGSFSIVPPVGRRSSSDSTHWMRFPWDFFSGHLFFEAVFF